MCLDLIVRNKGEIMWARMLCLKILEDSHGEINTLKKRRNEEHFSHFNLILLFF